MSVQVILGMVVAMLALVSVGSGEQISATVNIDQNRMIEWSVHPAPTVYRHGEFSFATASVGDRAESAQDIIDLRVLRDGLPFSDAAFQTSYGAGGIGIFEMGVADPVLVIVTYSGGAHCCTYFNLLPLGGEPNWTVAGGFDGDGFELDDVDGDGTFEIARPDPRFAHTAGAMTGLWAPPLIVGFWDEQLRDVTSAPRYRSHLLDAERATSADCGGEGGWFTQGCVAWGVIAYRLGTLDEVLGEVALRVETAPADTGMAKSGFVLIENEINEMIRNLKVCVPIKRRAFAEALLDGC